MTEQFCKSLLNGIGDMPSFPPQTRAVTEIYFRDQTESITFSPPSLTNFSQYVDVLSIATRIENKHDIDA